jgi:hypothetical protein
MTIETAAANQQAAYLDTSALVKLVVNEAEPGALRGWVHPADAGHAARRPPISSALLLTSWILGS